MLGKIELNLISLIQRLKQTHWPSNEYFSLSDEIDKLVANFMENSFTGLNSDFLTNNAVREYYQSTHNQQMKFWFLINEYTASEKKEKHAKLAEIENFLQKFLLRIKDDSILKSKDILEPEFVRQLYLLKDPALISLFLRYLPPKHTIFHEDDKIPENFLDREAKVNQSVKETLTKNNNNVDLVEKKIVIIQRLFRAKQRQKENLQRAIRQYSFYLKALQESNNLSITPEQLLADANNPYDPKECEPSLSARLIKISKNVTPFTTIKHICSQKYLKSILDAGLYGRRTLLQFYLPFVPSSLNSVDVTNGDGNVICFGANNIDNNAYQGDDKIEIELEIKKITKNPCIFYKQLDLGHPRAPLTRTIQLGDSKLIFATPSGDSNNYFTHMEMALQKAGEKCIKGVAMIPNVSLISSNLPSMQQILTLNFFRFLDNLNDNELTKAIYDEINKLDDAALLSFLNQLNIYMTDIMEFNFYGAHKLDFNTVLSVSKLKKPMNGNYGDKIYSLNLSDFINALNSGDRKTFETAQTHLPQLFNSYRFIDYLLEKIQQPDIRLLLKQYKEKCYLPDWLTFRNFNPNAEHNNCVDNKLIPTQEHFKKS